MQKNKTKSNTKNNQTWASLRLRLETKPIATKLLKKANNKNFGGKIKMDKILKLALSNITDIDIESLQRDSLSFEDKKEQLRQIYIKKYGNLSKDEFTGFMMTPEYFNFLNEQSTNLKMNN